MLKSEPKENYPDFDYAYLEAVLTRGVLSDAELVLFLKIFGLGSYEEYAGNHEEIKNMCFVLINEAPIKKLLEEVKVVMDEIYMERLSYDEALKIYKQLKNLDLNELKIFFEEHLDGVSLKNTANEDDLIVLILGKLLELSRHDALARTSADLR